MATITHRPVRAKSESEKLRDMYERAHNRSRFISAEPSEDRMKFPSHIVRPTRA